MRILDTLDPNRLIADDLTNNEEKILPLLSLLLPCTLPLPPPPCTSPPHVLPSSLPSSILSSSALPTLLSPALSSSVSSTLLSPVLSTPLYSELEGNAEELMENYDRIALSTPLSPSVSPLLLPRRKTRNLPLSFSL